MTDKYSESLDNILEFPQKNRNLEIISSTCKSVFSYGLPFTLGVGGLFYFSKVLFDGDADLFGYSGVALGMSVSGFLTGYVLRDLFKRLSRRGGGYDDPDPDDPERDDIPERPLNVIELDAVRDRFYRNSVANYD
ncbi:hypothetical protein D6774_02795 [Candidatus Woesearchaeota archaeon]|nr:MAG: hypothetical protein D6774_02795 [Candidatus Woesearchaeota archaeon]